MINAKRERKILREERGDNLKIDTETAQKEGGTARARDLEEEVEGEERERERERE